MFLVNSYQFGFLLPNGRWRLFQCWCLKSLMHDLGYEHETDEWSLFIDSSRPSLKAVLLHDGNQKPAVPVAHAVGLKKTYEFMENLLKLTQYADHKWNLCGDLKVVSLLLGIQLGYTKYMCILCLWNSRNDVSHYSPNNGLIATKPFLAETTWSTCR